MKFSLPNFNFKSALSLFQKENAFLGVDIGTSSIKVVELKKDKERAVLETYGELSLANYGKSEAGQPFVLIHERLKEAVKDLLRESQTKARRAIVSIPLKNSFITTMSLPQLAEDELKDAVAYEARKYIPVPISETMIDWWVLPPQSTEAAASSIGSAKRQLMSVLLVAVPNEVVAKYKSVFEHSGVSVEAFEIESFSLARAVLRQEGGSTLLIDMGAATTKMVMTDSGVVRMSHSVDHGAWGLTQALQQSLGIDFARAEALKREFGIVRRPETQGSVSVLEPLVDVLGLEAERFVLEWRRRGGRSASKVILAGGGSLLRGVDAVFIKKLGVEVETTNPFSRVVYPAFLEPALKEIGPIFANAMGLALRNF